MSYPVSDVMIIGAKVQVEIGFPRMMDILGRARAISSDRPTEGPDNLT